MLSFLICLKSVYSLDIHSAVSLSAQKRKELFEITRVYLTNDIGREVLTKAFSGSLKFKNRLKNENLKVPKNIDDLLTEGNLLRLLEENKKFRKLLMDYKKLVNRNKKRFVSDFLSEFEKIDKKEGIRLKASKLDPSRPHILLDQEGKPSTRYLEVFTNHPMILDDGEVIEASDLFEEKKRFIRSLTGDIIANVYDFDLLGLADEFVEKVKEGSNVLIGIDKQTFEKKIGVRRVVNRLRRGGVKVVLVKTDGINHQKIIAGGIGKPGQGKLIFSSANFTASCIHPAGDFGESGLDHELSYPNANHFVEIHDDQLLTLVEHELAKTLELKLPINAYPLSNSYQLLGPKVSGYGSTDLTVAFTPNGGLSNIMSNILAPEIIGREGPLYLATFAYPTGDSHDAVFERAKLEMQRNGRFEVLTVGDSFFSTREWAAPLEMIGHQVEHIDDTGIKLYTPNFDNRWLFNLGREEMRRMMGQIYAAPEEYGRHQVEVDGEVYEVEAKLHHKLKVLDANVAVIGNSANFSKSAVAKNHEQFLMVNHPVIANKARGIVRGLVDKSRKTLFQLISSRNKYKRGLDDRIRTILAEINKLISSSDEEIDKIDKLALELEELVGFEQARKIILNSNKDLIGPIVGSPQIAFSFDLDDNVLKLGTEIIVYHKETGEEKTVSTHYWRRVKNQIGVSGKWKDFELRSTSFSNFTDDYKIVEDLIWAIENKPDRWKGPVFDRFVEAMSTEESAKNSTIITARGSRLGVYRALKTLRDRGIIKFIPPKKHIWAMSDPSIPDHFNEAFGKVITPGGATDISEKKAMVMEEVLDIVNRKRVFQDSSLLTSADGEENKRLLLWTYSDDDIDNFNAAIKTLQEGVDNGRWPNVKIGLYYTGPIIEGMTDRQVIIQPNKPPRRFTIREELEWIQNKFGGQRKSQFPKDCTRSLKDLLGIVLKNKIQLSA